MSMRTADFAGTKSRQVEDLGGGGGLLNTKFTTMTSFLGRSMSSMTRKGLKMKISKTALMNLVKLKRRLCHC
jgi:hypothetical protein